MSETILMCGSRTWTDRATIQRVVGALDRDTHIIHGGAAGADALVEDACRLLGFSRTVYSAEWSRYGRAAGPIRNQEMLDIERPTRAIAFRMPGASPGTDDMLRRARAAGLPVEVIEPS